MMRSTIKSTFEFLKILNQNVELISSSISETIKTLERPYILQKNQYLELKLNQLGEGFSKMYQSAWNALESDNPDRLRHCCSTLRELLNNVINEKGNGKDREEKLAFILRNQDEIFSKSFTKYVMAIFKLLGKCVHKDTSINETTFTLTMVEDALLVLFLSD